MAGSRCYLLTKPVFINQAGRWQQPAGFVNLQTAKCRPHHRHTQTKSVARRTRSPIVRSPFRGLLDLKIDGR
jgi:hypothetical protein